MPLYSSQSNCKVTDLREICLQFGPGAEAYLHLGLSRQISKEEALEVLKVAEKEGLVLSPLNALYPTGFCLCCACCCEYLGNKRKLPRPVEFFETNYYAVITPDQCTGCGTCVDRCQMDALTLIDEISTVNRDRCIGCGICVPTCPEEAIKLQKIDEEKIYSQTIPKSVSRLYQKIYTKKKEIQKKG